SCPPPPPAVKGFNVALYPLLDGRRADWTAWNVTLRSDGGIEGLFGSWVTFERAGNYKLRGVEAALQDLQSPAVPYATDLPATGRHRPAAELPGPRRCPLRRRRRRRRSHGHRRGQGGPADTADPADRRPGRQH